MIRLSPRLALPALAAALALILAAELLAPQPDAALASAPAIPASAQDDSSDAAVAQWSADSLARPLFSPTRRPADAGDSTGTLRLAAIIIVNGTRRAIFSDGGPQPQIAGEGGTVDGYQVQRITPGAVQLLGPGGPVTLHPQFITPTPPTSADNGNNS